MNVEELCIWRNVLKFPVYFDIPQGSNVGTVTHVIGLLKFYRKWTEYSWRKNTSRVWDSCTATSIKICAHYEHWECLTTVGLLTTIDWRTNAIHVKWLVKEDLTEVGSASKYKYLFFRMLIIEKKNRILLCLSRTPGIQSKTFAVSPAAALRLPCGTHTEWLVLIVISRICYEITLPDLTTYTRPCWDYKWNADTFTYKCIIIICIICIQPEGRLWQEPEPSQATGMALAHCILGNFLGVGCHCFPPPLDVPTFASRDLYQRKTELRARNGRSILPVISTST